MSIYRKKPRTVFLIVAVAIAGQATAWAQIPLVEAARAGDSAAVIAMIEGGVDVRAAEADGTTALHWAVNHDDAGLVRRLVEAGAGAAASNDFMATPMSIAADVGNTDVIRMLLEAGADPDSPNAYGQTALMTLARNTNVQAARLLLEAGADPNAVERQRNQTALMWAAAESQAPMARLLVEFGANVDAISLVNDRSVSGQSRTAGTVPPGGRSDAVVVCRAGRMSGMFAGTGGGRGGSGLGRSGRRHAADHGRVEYALRHGRLPAFRRRQPERLGLLGEDCVVPCRGLQHDPPWRAFRPSVAGQHHASGNDPVASRIWRMAEPPAEGFAAVPGTWAPTVALTA